jgi:hypothetical protein
MSDAALRSSLIRLAKANPNLRNDLLTVLAGCEKLPEGGMRDNCEKKKEEGKEASSRRTADLLRSSDASNTTAIRPATAMQLLHQRSGAANVGIISELLQEAGRFFLGYEITDPEDMALVELRDVSQALARKFVQKMMIHRMTGDDFSMKAAGFPADSIGELVPGAEGGPGSDAKKPWMKGEFTQQEFEELDEKQVDGDLSDGKAEFEPMKMASENALRVGLIRLAQTHPEFRQALLPILKDAGCEKLPEGGMRDNCEKKKEEGKDEKKEAAGGPASNGRNWKEITTGPHRWVWDDGKTAFQVVEFSAGENRLPGYRLVVTTEIHGENFGPMKWKKSTVEKEPLFEVAAKWYKAISGFQNAQGGGIDFSQWQKLGSA